MLFPDWFVSALATLPAVIGLLLGVGLPYALVGLPRKDWHDKPLVAMTVLGIAPMLLTAWMFILGTVGGIYAAQAGITRIPGEAYGAAYLTLPNIITGLAVLALIGIVLAIRKLHIPVTSVPRRLPLERDEQVIVVMIIAACVLRYLTTLYWNFIEYDPLWVYGYQGRLYTLLGYIPTDIGYYPPFLQLQYVFGQLAAAPFTGLALDDHAAKAFVPLLHWGSILAAYILGRRLFNRRVGVYLAGLWALYPHVGLWAHVGDLEIPLTFGFTAAAACFLMAWLSTEFNEGKDIRQRLHYAALAGIFLGMALWTKPTGGAFILGVVLLVALALVHQIHLEGFKKGLIGFRHNPRLHIAIVTGLACLPLGGVWYLRNFILGLQPIVFPHPFWQTQALRSGAEFGWLVLALGVLLALSQFAPLSARPNRLPLLLGVGLITAALLPTTLVQYDPAGIPNRMDILEWLLLFMGLAIIGVTFWRYAAHHLIPAAKWDAIKIGWALALAAPYFAVWFYSYSYHYRLSFAIVPLLALPTAVLVVWWVKISHTQNTQHVRLSRSFLGSQRSTLIPKFLLLACLPGVFITLYNFTGGWDWLWTNRFPNDFARLESSNLALAWTVKSIQEDAAAEGIISPVIIAPGLQRLPFFFPLNDVRIDTAPTDLDQLQGVDYYVYTHETAWFYPENERPLQNQVTAAFNRRNVMIPIASHEDRSFFGRVFRLREPERRWEVPRNLTMPVQPVQFGDFATFVGSRSIGERLNQTDPPLELFLVWQPTQTTTHDYMIYVHLLDSEGNFVLNWDGKPAQNEFFYYSTQLWEDGEYVLDTRFLKLPADVILPSGDYSLRIGMYDLTTNQRVPVKIGDQVDDGYTLPNKLRMIP